jgi:hypothetical protein
LQISMQHELLRMSLKMIVSSCVHPTAYDY